MRSKDISSAVFSEKRIFNITSRRHGNSERFFGRINSRRFAKSSADGHKRLAACFHKPPAESRRHTEAAIICCAAAKAEQKAAAKQAAVARKKEESEKQAEQDESHRDEYYNTIVNGFSNASDEIKAKAKELLAATGEPKFSSPNIPAATLRQIADLFTA